jgi:hypothetical protein
VNKVDKRIGLIAGLTALFAMGSAEAVDCPVDLTTLQSYSVASDINPETGHTFELFKYQGISWDEAQACVDLLPTQGGPLTPKHLATITSSSENAWIVAELLTPNLPIVFGEEDSRTQVWVGGYQDPSDEQNYSEPGGGWRWVNNEGPFSGVNGGISYTNWAPGEPNDAGEVPGSENHMALGRYEDYALWNDEGGLGLIGGFIVEYDTPRTANECTGSGTSTEACITIDGQTLTFPAGTFEPGDAISFTAYEFNDPRVIPQFDPFMNLNPDYGKCRINPGPLTLFTDPAFGGNAELRIPAYLCGSPKFVVVKVNSEDLTILKGAVFVKNETTETVLPDNFFKCFDPLITPPLTTPYAPDPQFQDVVVWQTTNPANMAENATTAPPEYVGAATEATNGCGSTTAKVRGASYFVIGMHIDFGSAAFDYVSNPEQNYLEFVKLTRYKLTLLRQSIAAARSQGSLRPVVSTTMEALIALAIYRLDRGNPAGALTQVRQFLQLVNVANYTEIPGKNFNGDHLMRGENIAFTLRVKVVPYKPVP